MAAIEFKHLHKAYGESVIVRDLSLQIADGELLVLVGPSGCGKSTILRMLAGLLEPTSGEILIDGVDVTRRPPGERDIAMVFQSYALYPHMTVAENIGFPLRVRRLAAAQIAGRVAEVADILGIGELLPRLPRDLSGGQRQRVAMGRAIIREPKAFLFDEPLSNLDAALRGRMRGEIAALHRRLGATMIYVTHDQHEAMTLADRLVLLSGGVIAQAGAPLEVYHAPASRFVAEFLGSPPMGFLPALADQGRVRCAGMDLPAGQGALPAALWLGVRPERLRVVRGGSGSDGPTMRGKVEWLERTGGETLLYVQIEAERLVARLAGEHDLDGLHPGAEVQLALSEAHLFDRADGSRLGVVSPGESAPGVGSAGVGG